MPDSVLDPTRAEQCRGQALNRTFGGEDHGAAADSLPAPGVAERGVSALVEPLGSRLESSKWRAVPEGSSKELSIMF